MPVLIRDRQSPRAIDAWIDPPAYTGKPPIFLKVGDDDGQPKLSTAPEDSVLVVRADPESGHRLRLSGGLASAVLGQAPQGERRFTLYTPTVRAERSYQGVTAAGRASNLKVGRASTASVDPSVGSAAG